MNYNLIRRKTKEIKIGQIAIGGNQKIAIQSMTNTDTHDTNSTIQQINALKQLGCDIVRITVQDMEAAEKISIYKQAFPDFPLVADIHFDYKIALRCAELGIDKIRINPGNIGDDEHVREVCQICCERNIPIRIGVNSGSLEKHILQQFGAPTPRALCESALYHIRLCEKYNFSNLIVSIKASNIYDMVEANRLLAQEISYPIHLGVTEAGLKEMGQLKSAIGIGSLLESGIGDTLRVSLTANPLEEVAAAKKILQAMEIEGQCGMDIVSCPTCGRTQVHLIELVSQFETVARQEGLMDLPIKVALMGCVVNGPGEAREADIGIAGGKGEALLFKKDKICGKIKEENIVNALILEIKKDYL